MGGGESQRKSAEKPERKRAENGGRGKIRRGERGRKCGGVGKIGWEKKKKKRKKKKKQPDLEICVDPRPVERSATNPEALGRPLRQSMRIIVLSLLSPF